MLNNINDNHTRNGNMSQTISDVRMMWTYSYTNISDYELQPDHEDSLRVRPPLLLHDQEEGENNIADDHYVDGCLPNAEVKDMGRLRTVAMVSPDNLTLVARESIRRAVLEKNTASRGDPTRIEVQQREWQVAAAAEILCGRDTYVITATGSGKTMCFQLALFARPGSIIVVSPLLALMDDQVSGAARLGIKAAQISEQAIKADPDLVDKVRQGEFRLVFLQPEFCHASNGLWRRMTAPRTRFAQGVFCVVIDEAHLIHQWRTFRASYGHLANMRHTFTHASFMLCSATMITYTRRFVHRTMNLGPNLSFIHRSVDRPNVFIAVKPIVHGTKDHHDLYYLVPEDIHHPANIPQTIVFVDSRPEAKQMCDEFWTRVPTSWVALSHLSFIFGECSTALSAKRRWVVMNAFRTGLCCILFTTEVAGMGIDFPYVERVVQWRVGVHLNISAVLQRLGRGSRRLGTQGVFILYHTRSYIINSRSNPMLAIFKTNASHGLTDSHVVKCIKAVESWSNGTFRMTPPEDPLDVPIIPFEVHPPEKESLAAMSVASYQDESESDNAASALNSEHLPDNAAKSEDDDGGSIASIDPEHHDRQGRQRGYPATCRGISWLINTEGCRRAVLLTLFDDAGYNPSRYAISNSSVPTCCDSHLAAFRTQHDDNDAVHSLIRLLPPEQSAALSKPIAPDYESNSNEDKQPVQQRRQNITRLQRLKVRQALQELRLQIWEELAAGSQFFPYTPHKFLPDSYIERIVSMSAILTTVEDLSVALAKTARMSSLLVPFLPRILATATKAHSDNALPAGPVGRPLKRRAPAQPLHVITAHAAIDSPQIQQHIQANEQVRLEHEAQEDQREQQRQKNREYMKARKIQRGNTQTPDDTMSKASNNPYADLIPGSIPAPASGIPSDIYDIRSIPADLHRTLPPLGRGRPSKILQTRRHAIIRSYWTARGYKGE